MKRTPKISHSLLMAWLTFVLLAPVFLGGCAGGKTLTGSERDAVLAYAEPTADNLLQGMNAGDYAAFSRDFNAAMLKGISAETFTSNLLPGITGKLGKYISRQVASVTAIGSNVLVIYTAKFEQDEQVTIRLSLEQASPHHVSGLYFNSPKLQEK